MRGALLYRPGRRGAQHGGIALLHRDTHFDKLAEVLTFENVELPVS